MSLSHHPNIVRNGLVAYFDAANPKSYPAGQDPYVNNVSLMLDGESLVDQSANARTFTASVGASVSTANKKFGNSSIYCTGSTSYIYNSSFNSSFSGDFTIEFWAYHNSFGSSNALIVIGNESSGRHVMFINGSGKVAVDLYFTGTIGTFNTTISTGTWNHYVLTRSGTTVKLFVNGTLDSTTVSVSGTFGNGNGVYIGAVSSAVNGSNAYFDDIRITSGISRYAASFTPPAAPLSLPGRITDLTTNKVIGTLTNGPTYSAGSLVFYGTNDYITSPTSTLFNFATGDFTVEMWVYPTSVKTFSLLDFRINETNPNGNAFVIGTSASNLWVVYQNGNQITGPTVVANQWTQVVVNRVGTAVKMFLNGAQIGSTWTTSNSFTDGAFVLGTDYPLNARFFQGRLSSVKIYKGKGLSNNEILQNYNALKGRFIL